MVTNLDWSVVGNDEAMCAFVGLSTDTKPVVFNERNVANGSVLLEMDTGDLYMYDKSGEQWLKQ